jgi:ATP-dependent helicase/nuclease subunit A
LHRHIENLQDLEERKRLLYVACTRAADYLILSSSIADVERPKSDWLQLVDRTVSLADGSLRRPLPPGYGTPSIRVTTDPPRGAGAGGVRSRGPDLERLVAKTRELAATGAGRLPPEAAAIPVDTEARRRFSFSRLSGQLMVEASGAPGTEAPLARAAVGTFTSVELGRLIHAVMERIDFRRPEEAAELCRFLAPQEAPGAPGPATERAAAMIERFLASPRADELSRARAVRREIEFVLAWPPFGDYFHGRYLQGRLDCLYQDERGRWWLLDYKSNRIDRRDVSQAVERYELQMLAYALACERVLGEPLAACGLELLDPGIEYCFTWDEAARRRGIERITAAMDAPAPAEFEELIPIV